ncbi:MAG: polyprenyl synthetase family protein [Clostridia bacterium]|nr:polyprenyl synthetase family protein [Clostridia bacterium]
MENIFINSLDEYRKKCDMFLLSDEFQSFLDSFGVTCVMKKYYDAFLRQCDGGKRVRAYLVQLGYEIFAKDVKADKAFLPSLSYELFQTGILAHDDIIDNSETRRFKPSMHMDLGGGHPGISKSICAGDFGIVAALEIIARSDFDDKTKLRAISHQNKVFVSTIAGELRDIEFSGTTDVQEKDILYMNHLKTAQYTVSGPLVLGAILSGADEKSIQQTEKFGNLVGIAFQIRDDILGMFGDEKKLGKSVTADMCEGKQTVLSAHFINNSSEEDKAAFYKIYGKEASGEKELLAVRELLIKSGSFEYAKSLCESMVNDAAKILEQLDISNESKNKLLGLLDYMTKRVN